MITTAYRQDYRATPAAEAPAGGAGSVQMTTASRMNAATPASSSTILDHQRISPP